MMTNAQIDNWFAAMTADTEAARAIRDSANQVIDTMTWAWGDDGAKHPEVVDKIGQACKHLALVIDEHAPDSADKIAAIRCVRIAAACAFDALWLVQDGTPDPYVEEQARANARAARWQANSAIACNGK